MVDHDQVDRRSLRIEFEAELLLHRGGQGGLRLLQRIRGRSAGTRRLRPSIHPAAEFRQGNTLGPAHRHWFRANRFRLFFRPHSAARIVVYAWVNDRDTLCKAGAASDRYAGMLAARDPRDEWSKLLAAAQDPAVAAGFTTVTPKD